MITGGGIQIRLNRGRSEGTLHRPQAQSGQISKDSQNLRGPTLSPRPLRGQSDFLQTSQQPHCHPTWVSTPPLQALGPVSFCTHHTSKAVEHGGELSCKPGAPLWAALGCAHLSQPQFLHFYQEGLGQIISKDHSTHRRPENDDSTKDAVVQPHPVSAPSLKVTKAVDPGHRAWVWLSSDSGAQ